MLFTLILLQQLLPTPQKKEGVIACNFLSCTNEQSATCVRWKVEQSVEALHLKGFSLIRSGSDFYHPLYKSVSR